MTLTPPPALAADGAPPPRRDPDALVATRHVVWPLRFFLSAATPRQSGRAAGRHWGARPAREGHGARRGTRPNPSDPAAHPLHAATGATTRLPAAAATTTTSRPAATATGATTRLPAAAATAAATTLPAAAGTAATTRLPASATAAAAAAAAAARFPWAALPAAAATTAAAARVPFAIFRAAAAPAATAAVAARFDGRPTRKGGGGRRRGLPLDDR